MTNPHSTDSRVRVLLSVESAIPRSRARFGVSRAIFTPFGCIFVEKSVKIEGLRGCAVDNRKQCHCAQLVMTESPYGHCEQSEAIPRTKSALSSMGFFAYGSE